MAWEKVKIKEIWKGFYDGPHATPPVSDCGGIFLGISNITPNGHIDLSDIKYISEQDLPKWTKRVVPQGGDIVFSYEATLNLYAIIPENFYGCLGRRMALIRVDENKISNKFLYYYFFSDEWRATIAENTIVGATVDRIPIAKFPEFPISLPPLKEQKRIADILSAYDNLIENNQKQIKLLEEAAQRLYKQWFIDLRYPGHETTKIVDGIPEGWHYGSITEISTCYDCKRKPLSSKERDQQEKIYPYYGAASLMDYVEKFIFEGVYLLFGEDGTVITSDETPMLQYIWGKFWVNNHAHIFQGANGYSTEFLYMLCKHMKIKDIVTGVAQPKVSQGRLNDKKIVIPSRTMVAKYSELTQSFFKQIRLLSDAINASKEARDRLLPKLMNNEI